MGGVFNKVFCNLIIFRRYVFMKVAQLSVAGCYAREDLPSFAVQSVISGYLLSVRLSEYDVLYHLHAGFGI